MKDVVIFAGAAGSVLSICRSIKKEFDVRTYVLCESQSLASVFKSSRYVDDVHVFSNLSNDGLKIETEAWLQERKFAEKPVLYFASDNSCYEINKDRAWFAQYFVLCLPSSYIIESFTKKGIAEREAEVHGLSVPRTRKISSLRDIEYVTELFAFPVIIKPIATYDKAGVDFKAKILRSSNELREITERLVSQNSTFICQEYIRGTDEKVFYYLFYRNEAGLIWDTMGVKTLQSPPHQGIMAIGTSKDLPKVKETSRKFLNKIGYCGLGGIEYKENNGQIYFIEMSTRLEGFFQIAKHSKVPLETISYRDILELENKSAYSQKNGVRFLDLIPLVKARIIQKNYFGVVKDIISGLILKNSFLNVFDFKDPKPFFLIIKKIILR